MPRMKNEIEAQNCLHNAGWYAASMLKPVWPISAPDAALLLHDGGGYAVDPVRLTKLVDSGIIAKPGPAGWSAIDVMAAADVLFRRRQFRDRSDVRYPEGVNDAPTMNFSGDARAAIFAMVDAPDDDVREQLAAILIDKLKSDHGVTV